MLGAVVAVAALAGAVAGGAAGPDPVASREPAANASPVTNEKVQDAIASGRLLFVGASYTVGLGATAPGAGYAPVLAHRLDRRFTVAAVSGTGFVNPGKYRQGTFGERMERLPATLDPRIVVIQGGRNDVAYPPSQLEQAAGATIRLARQRFDRAQVVVMGPIPAMLPIGPRLYDARDAVRAAARAAGAGFIDPIAENWITRGNEEQYAGPVAAHPNDAGYRYIAGRLLGDLPEALEHAALPRSG